jgi:nucleoid-associated protein YgaU
MTPDPGASGWRVAAGCVAGLLALCALVVWRSLHLTGGWLLALRVTAVIAVLGLLAGAWLAVLQATRPAVDGTGPDQRRELLLRVVPGAQGPATQLVPGTSTPADGRGVRRAVALALLAALPVLLVLVLAAPPEPAGAAGAVHPTAGATPSAIATSVPTPSATSPGPSAGTDPSSSTPPTSQPPATPQPATCEVSVRPGDTLWDLAAERLGPQASAADVARTWQEDYARNRTVIGPDPDLIRPGQVLTVPCR